MLIGSLKTEVAVSSFMVSGHMAAGPASSQSFTTVISRSPDLDPFTGWKSFCMALGS